MGHQKVLAGVLEPLYGALLEPGRMQEFCDRLRQGTGSSMCGVLVEDVSHRQGRMAAVSGVDPDDIQAYEQEYAAENIWVNRSRNLLASGQLYDSDDWASREEFMRGRYYQEFLRKFDDVRQSLALCAWRDERSVVLATVSLPARYERYDAEPLALLRQVLPHWTNTYAIQRRLSWLQGRIDSLDHVVHGLGTALFLLDDGGKVQRMNAAAEACLRAGGPLHLADGQLQVSHDPDKRFARMLAGATHGMAHDGGQHRHQGKAPLRDGRGRVIAVATIHPLPRALDVAANDGSSAAMLFVEPLQSDRGEAMVAALRELFALTAGEAALAAALYARGDLALAAHACGIAVSTAQTRLKLVYDKTGEHGQTALMRLLAAVARTVSG